MTSLGRLRITRIWKRLAKRKIQLVLFAAVILCLTKVMRTNSEPHRTPRYSTAKSAAPVCLNCPPRSVVHCNNCSVPNDSSLHLPDPVKEAEDTIFPYTYLANSPRACKSSSLQFLVAVSSAAENLVDRQLVRMSLQCSYRPNASIRHVFFMGRPDGRYPMGRISEEVDTHGDIVMGDFPGTLDNATLVSVMILKWTITFCPNADFIVKLSTNGRVNPRALLSSYDVFRDFHMEYDLYGTVVPLDGQPCQPMLGGILSYCPGMGYLVGCAYIITQQLVRPMFYAVAENTIIPSEDIYMTYLLAESVGARRMDVVLINGCYFSYGKRKKPGFFGSLKVMLGFQR